MESCFVEWDEFSGDSLRSDRTLSFCSQELLSDSSPWNSSRDGSQKSMSPSSFHANLSGRNSHQLSKSLVTGDDSIPTDVKRVRALFENSSASSSEDETNFSRTKFNKVNSGCKRLKESNWNSLGGNGSGGGMRSAYSHLSLHQMGGCDFADLLVNDNVIIEDSPDVFQLFRQSRHRDNVGGSGSKVSSSTSTLSRSSALRRSKSVGGGIHQLDDGEDEEMSLNPGKNSSSSTEDLKGRPCIRAEEMPAPDTVKNARTVFEQLYQKTKAKVVSQENIAPPIAKALSSIRSNPTSKILRSESMRVPDVIKVKPDPAPVVNITISMNSTAKKTTQISKVFETSAASIKSPAPSSTKVSIPRTVSKVWPNLKDHQKKSIEDVQADLTASQPLFASDLPGDDDEGKEISPDVLNRIRSCGTTTTYFGGEILAKTVQNRKLAVPKKTNSFDDHPEPFNPTTEFNYPAQAQEVFFSARPNQAATNEKNNRRPFDLQYNSSPTIDTTPRIISVLPKSQPNSPTKSGSPPGSPMEGRDSPEGCESGRGNIQPEWIHDDVSPGKPEDGNNNNLESKFNTGNKFSSAAEGAWF